MESSAMTHLTWSKSVVPSLVDIVMINSQMNIETNTY